MGGFQYLLICRQRQFLLHQIFRLGFMGGKGLQQKIDVTVLEVVGRLLDFILVVYVKIRKPFGLAGQIEDVFDSLADTLRAAPGYR